MNFDALAKPSRRQPVAYKFHPAWGFDPRKPIDADDGQSGQLEGLRKKHAEVQREEALASEELSPRQTIQERVEELERGMSSLIYVSYPEPSSSASGTIRMQAVSRPVSAREPAPPAPTGTRPQSARASARRQSHSAMRPRSAQPPASRPEPPAATTRPQSALQASRRAAAAALAAAPGRAEPQTPRGPGLAEAPAAELCAAGDRSAESRQRAKAARATLLEQERRRCSERMQAKREAARCECMLAWRLHGRGAASRSGRRPNERPPGAA